MKKSSKRMLSIFLATIMIFAFMTAVMPTVLLAGSLGDYEFDVRNGEVSITGYTGVGGAITIPNTISGYPVTSIGGSAFYNCSSLTSVIIPNGVVSISVEGAFTDSNIPSGSFYGCTELTSVTIPDSVTSINDRAFFGCSKLTNVTIPSKVTNIGASAFDGCAVLSTAIIPESVISIGDRAFFGCSKLTNVTIPTKLSFLGSGVFGDCMGLTSVTIPYSVDSSYNTGTFKGCTGLTNMIISRGVEGIGGDEFSGCTGLTSAIIPKSVTNIGESAFDGCSNLTIYGENGSFAKEFAVNHNIPFVAEEYFFTISNDKVSIMDYMGTGGTITIPDTLAGYPVTAIGEGAFYGCTELTSVAIPDSVTSIAVEDWITVPDGKGMLPNIGAFNAASKLVQIIVGDSNLSYSSQDGVLFNKTKTVLITCPEGKSGDYLIPNSVTSLGKYAFDNCQKLTSVTIPDSVTSINDGAFSHCFELTSVIISDSVTSIGNMAFEFCTKLTSVTIPDSVTAIGEGAFDGCNLTAAFFLGNAPQMGNGVFGQQVSKFKVHYISGKTGFTNPWHEYKTTNNTSGVKIGGVIATVVFFVVAGVLTLILLRKKRKQEL